MRSTVVEIAPSSLALIYALLVIPALFLLHYRVRLLKGMLVSILRMTVQLLFVGFYLQFVFELNLWWLNLLWLLIMSTVADASIIQNSGLRTRPLFAPVLVAILAGTLLPLLTFVGIILRRPAVVDAQYFIPIAGMIMGNCLRASVVGLAMFYRAIRDEERSYLLSLSQGATLAEATLPFLRRALHAALSPTVASMATIGLVALPGMMTGIILGGTNPSTAIRYQIGIMLSIFVGTSITVVAGIILTRRAAFTPYGVLDRSVFRNGQGRG